MIGRLDTVTEVLVVSEPLYRFDEPTPVVPMRSSYKESPAPACQVKSWLAPRGLVLGLVSVAAVPVNAVKV